MSKRANRKSSNAMIPSGRPAALTDVARLRARARKSIDKGAITESYTADRKEVIRLLNPLAERPRSRATFAASTQDVDAVPAWLAEAETTLKGELGHRDLLCPRSLDHLVVDVGEVPDEADLVAARAEPAMEDVERDERAASVPDVAEVVDRHPTDVEADLAGGDRPERLDGARQRVVEAERQMSVDPLRGSGESPRGDELADLPEVDPHHRVEEFERVGHLFFFL